MSNQTVATKIAEVSNGLKFTDLPPQAVGYAKTLLLDVLGSMIGTRHLESSLVAREIGEELAGPAEASIVGSGKKVSAPAAAFSNAIQCYSFDFVDDHNESNAHPSPATYPTSLALCEQLKKSGQEFIMAAALGNEVVCRMGSAYLGDMYYQGFHPTSTCGTIGAAVSASKLYGLDVRKTVYAQGIAGSMVAGLMAWNSEGSYTKRLQAGHPAMNAIIAARMAQKGFNGPSDIFEGKDGLLHAYSFKDHYDSKWLTETFGKEWIFTTSSIKVYPCCRYSGGHTDACLELVAKHAPKAEEIAKIHIRSSKYTMRLLAEQRKWDPQNVVDLQFSMPYQAAAAFLFGKVTVDEFDVKHIANPEIKRLISVCDVVEDPEFERRYPDQYSSAVEITMKDGAKYEAVVDNPKGDKRNPVTHADVENKFSYLANRVYSDKSVAEKIKAFVNDLENQKDMSELVAMIVAGK